jgi:ADP-heptose:LPS heptosyltransferase
MYQKYIPRLIDFILDTLLRSYVSIVRTKNRRGDNNAVLLIMFGGIGDYLFFTASLPAYRKLFLGKKIILIGRHELASMMERISSIDDFIPVNYKQFRQSVVEKCRIASALSSFDFTCCINASYSTNFEYGERSVVLWSGAQKRITFKCFDRYDCRNYSLYTDIVETDPSVLFEIDRNNAMVEYLGMKGYHNYTMQIEGVTEKFREVVEKKFVLPPQYCVVFPGSSSSMKNWPPTRYAEVLKRVKCHIPVVFCGSQSEFAAAHELQTLLPEMTTIDLTGKTTVIELAGIIANSFGVLSNDSAAVHLAGALEVPCVVVLGGGHYGRFLPYPYPSSIVTVSKSMNCFQCEWHCRYDTVRCINAIEVAAVAKEFQIVLDRSEKAIVTNDQYKK